MQLSQVMVRQESRQHHVNIANEYATKRYRSNLINWGMLPFIIDKGELPFTNGDYIFIPKIADAVKNKATSMKAYVVNKDMKEFELKMDELTDDEREIILDGCLINYYRNHQYKIEADNGRTEYTQW